MPTKLASFPTLSLLSLLSLILFLPLWAQIFMASFFIFIPIVQRRWDI